MDSIRFSFAANQEGDYTIVRIRMEGVDAYFKYTDPESIGVLIQNLGNIIDYAVEEYTLGKQFKNQLENELDDWLNDGNND